MCYNIDILEGGDRELATQAQEAEVVDIEELLLDAGIDPEELLGDDGRRKHRAPRDIE